MKATDYFLKHVPNGFKKVFYTYLFCFSGLNFEKTGEFTENLPNHLIQNNNFTEVLFCFF